MATDEGNYKASPCALDPYRHLAAAVFCQALRDFVSGDPVRYWDSLFWLAGPDAPYFLSFVGFEASPLDLLCNCSIAQLKKRSRRFIYE